MQDFYQITVKIITDKILDNDIQVDPAAQNRVMSPRPDKSQ